MKIRWGLSSILLWWIGFLLLFWVLWNFLASRNPMYSSERLLWPTQIEALRIAKDPVSAAPANVQRTLSRLQQVIQRYPGSNAAARAQFLIGEVYAAQKEYVSAVQAFERVLTEYAAMSPYVIDAYRAIAGVYLAEKSWKKALETYQTVLSKYPMDLRVLDIPQLMVGIARPNAPDAGDSTLGQAIGYYQDAIRQSKPASTLYLVAQQRLAGCYLIAARWKEAAQTYETLVMTYFNRPEIPLWVKNVEELGKRRLGDPARGRNLALQFAERYPQRRQVVEPWLRAGSQKGVEKTKQ